MTDATRELVAAAERTADFLDSRGYEGDKLRVYVAAVKAEEKPQTQHWHSDLEIVDGCIVPVCERLGCQSAREESRQVMKTDWTQEELQAAGEAIYDISWRNEEKEYRPRREKWIARILNYELSLNTSSAIEIACQRNRLLAALKDVEEHHIEINNRVGMPLNRSRTLAIVRIAIAACDEEKRGEQ